jgi:membrane protease YdiL (CAAX protease family)
VLDPDWTLTRPILWAALIVLIALLILRTVRKDRREYRKFTRFRSTAKRQAMFRKWLLEAFFSFGATAAVALILAGAYVVPFITAIGTWPGIRDTRALLDAHPGIALGALLVAVIALVVLTVVGVRAAREDENIPTVGNITSLLPRNRQELRLGALLSINAGIMEELLFRLAIPALIFGASGSAVAAVVVSVLLFGSLHLYQGVPGIVGSSIMGAVFMVVFAVSGAIWVAIVLHALFDLRSLVVIPAAVYGVHKIDGVKHPYVAPRPKPAKAETTAAPAAPEP